MIVATFAVKTKVGNDFGAIDKATATIERYLYRPFVVLGTEMVDGLLQVVVAGAFPSGNTYTAEQLVQNQRDRFLSGLYPTTEPVLAVTGSGD